MPVSTSPYYVNQTDPPAKRAIMHAALDLFATEGVDGTNIREIAERAGYTNPALFRHFSSKDDLALALFETCYRRLQGALAAGGRRAGWRGAVEDAVQLIDEAPEGVHFVLETLRRYWPKLPQDARATPLPAMMRLLIEADARAGNVRADVDPHMAATIVIGALSQLARAAHFDTPKQPPAIRAAVLCAIICRGIEE
jgi:AcrR family transcriptional regulator